MVILTNFETNSLPQRIKYMQILVETSFSKHIFGVIPCSIYVDSLGVPKIIRWLSHPWRTAASEPLKIEFLIGSNRELYHIFFEIQKPVV